MNPILQKLSNQAFQTEIPFSGQFELTTKCNFRCNMCYLKSERNRDDSLNMPVSFWLNQAKQMKEAGTMVLGITGGETLLYSELEELLSGLSEMGFIISFNTNGSLLNEDNIMLLLKYPVAKVNISLYGACDETYRKLCHSAPGTFQKVLNGIDQLLEHGQNVYLTAVPVAENISELNKMEEIANSRGLKLHMAGYTFPSGCKYDCRLNPQEAAQTVVDHIYSTKSDKVRGLFQKQVQYLHRCSIGVEERKIFVCDGGKSSFVITADGKLSPCVMMKQIAINLNNKSFADAWTELKQETKETSVPSKCQTCDYAGNFCPGCKGAIAKEMDAYGEVSYLCEYAESMHNIAINELQNLSNFHMDDLKFIDNEGAAGQELHGCKI